MTSRERRYHINKRLHKLVWEEITRVIDEDILNQLNGEEPNPDIELFKINGKVNLLNNKA
jgi:hypothetical protein